jgi:mannose-6-phosphate isomerase-like protein (cupin superfamily)
VSELRKAGASEIVRGLQGQQQATGAGTLRESVQSGEALRDSYHLFVPDAEYGLTLGYTVVYPGCSTRGHAHEDLEEVYFVTGGEGEIVIDDRVETVKAGDGVRIPFGAFHQARNRGVEPVTYSWVTARRQSK